MFLQIAFGFSGDLGAVFPELTKIVGRYMVDVQACADGYSMSAGYAQRFCQGLCHKMVFVGSYRIDPAVTAQHQGILERGAGNGKHHRTDVRTISTT